MENKYIPTLIERWNCLHAGYLTLEMSSEALISDFDKLVNLHESTPKLWHFIRCHEDGTPMEKPKEGVCFDDFESTREHAEKVKEWEEAGKRCFWKGWRIKETTFHNDKMIQLTNGKRNLTLEHNGKHHFLPEFKTYEDIIRAGINLEPTKEKREDLNI